MNFGAQTVTFLSTQPTGDPDEVGTHLMAQTGTDVVGCRHRPVRIPGQGVRALTREFAEVGVSVATQWWQTTAPPVAAALAASPSDFLEVDGVTYQIIGAPEPYRDLSGNIVKVSILSERQDIGH